MTSHKVMIVAGAPHAYINQILDAIASVGGSILGDYTHCAFTNTGRGQFKPGASASPHTGEKEQINRVDETRIETFCDLDKARAVVQAIRAAHPYEEPVIYLIPLLSEDELP
jgi:hypothetical protein